MLNRLWLVGLSTLLAAGLSWLFPQLSAVVAGGAILIALAWRNQERAVTAIEERDGVRFYVVPTSPFRAIELVRTTGPAAPDERQRRRPQPLALARLRSFASCFHVRVLATFSLVSHPRRAVATPYRITPACGRCGRRSR